MHLRDYIDLGWKLFPCYSIADSLACTCNRSGTCEHAGKHPATAHGVKDATDDPNQIREWADRLGRVNWALACGYCSDVLVVDIDTHDANGFASIEMWEEKTGCRLPNTLTATTGSGGRHMFFHLNGRKALNRVNWIDGVDIRSNGGYVIIPPARHATGGVYTWDNWGTSVADAPQELLDSINDGTARKSLRDLGIDASNLYPLISQGLPEGQRDDGIFRTICSLRRQGLDRMGANGRVIAGLVAKEIARASNFPLDEALNKVNSAYSQDHENIPGDQPEGLRYSLNDTGNRQRFLDVYDGDIIYCPELGWFRWLNNSYGWETVDEDTVINLAERIPEEILDKAKTIDDPKQAAMVSKFALATGNRIRLMNLVKLCQGVPEIRRDVSDFGRCDTDLWCRNGVVDLRTGNVRPYSHADLTTQRSNVEYDPNVDYGWWEEFIHTSLGGVHGDPEMERYLQLAAGYTLTGRIDQECFFIISGPQASGKSTFVEGLRAALGGLATASKPRLIMEDRGNDDFREHELARLMGYRMVSIGEVRNDSTYDEQIVKAITGGDATQARKLYKEGFSFVPKFKLWISSNTDPRSADPAMVRRIKRIKFPNTIPVEQRDEGLKRKVKSTEGAKAILAWAVEGAQQYLADGHIDEPLAVTNAAKEWREDNDTIGIWMDTECDQTDITASTSVDELVTRYRDWSQARGIRRISLPGFTEEMKMRRTIIRDSSTGKRMVLGIRLKKSAESQMLDSLGFGL